jgi:hypothetical protein
MKPRCDKCPNSGTVHTRCKEYKDYRAEKDREIEARHVDTMINVYHMGSIVRASDAMRK